jgi:hypothetical protein
MVCSINYSIGTNTVLIRHLLTMTGNAIGIVSSILALSNISYYYMDLRASNVLLGVSAIFAWSNIVQYFAHNPKFYLLITSLRKGFPNVVRFIIGALPILIGYALCGMLLFGSYTKFFQGLHNSLVTLFASANGDALHDTFDAIYGQNKALAFFSRIYLGSFVCLFTYCVLNIFILIMEDAYFSVREGEMKNAIQKEFNDNLNNIVQTKIDTNNNIIMDNKSESDDDKTAIPYDDDFDLFDGKGLMGNNTNGNQNRPFKDTRRARKLAFLLEDLKDGYINVQLDGVEVEYIDMLLRRLESSKSPATPTTTTTTEQKGVPMKIRSPSKVASSATPTHTVSCSQDE